MLHLYLVREINPDVQSLDICWKRERDFSNLCMCVQSLCLCADCSRLSTSLKIPKN